jgi:hypothetical protein
MPTNPSTSSTAPRSTTVSSQQAKRDQLTQSAESALEQGVDYVRKCVRENPEAAALWCLGIGFVLGWKLKPW